MFCGTSCQQLSQPAVSKCEPPLQLLVTDCRLPAIQSRVCTSHTIGAASNAVCLSYRASQTSKPSASAANIT